MKWRVTAGLVGGFYVGEVEADAKEEAEELGGQLADATGAPSLCHHCGSRIDALELGEEIFVEPELEPCRPRSPSST